MAKIGYSFDYDKSRRPNNSGRVRRIVIFSILTVIAVSLFFILRPEKKKAAKDTVPKREPVVATAPKAKPPVKRTINLLTPPAKPVNKDVPKKPAVPQKPFVVRKADAATTSLASLAEEAFKKNDYAKTREICTKLLKSGKLQENSPLWNNVVDWLGQANMKILLSDMPFPEKKIVYTIQKNDALQKIARKYGTTVEAIQLSNNMKLTNYNIWLGQTLKIYKPEWSIAVSKSRKKLYLYDGKDLFKVYSIGTGKQNRTPVGTFVIVSKIKKPAWYSPSGKIIPFGSKENVLGTRWMKLSPTGTTDKTLRGYGIHGTWDNDSIGKDQSNGCIRMRNNEVEELFSIIPRKTPVSITE
jgi:lipoprotein-anchoring transpeptidase ErfK/SrfK